MKARENRRYERYPFSCDVSIYDAEGRYIGASRIIDLSLVGIKFRKDPRINRALAIGEFLKLNVASELGLSIDLDVIVVREDPVVYAVEVLPSAESDYLMYRDFIYGVISPIIDLRFKYGKHEQ